jgi:alpha-beta hydrolase superfamily lysophospholipase
MAHAVRADRRSMLGRAEFLHRAGYSVLLFDAQAHGESPGDRITFGYLEALDAAAAVSFAVARDPDSGACQ